MKFKHKASAFLLALTLGGGALLIPGVVSAQESPTTEAPAAEAAPAEKSAVVLSADLEDGDYEEGEFGDWEPTPEELAEFNSETDELIDALNNAGVSVERVVDEDGFVYPEFGENLTDADIEKIDAVITEIFGEGLETIEVDGTYEDGDFVEFDVSDLTDEDIAAFNAETAELADALRAAGIEVEVHAEDNGLDCLDFGDTELTEAQMDAIDAVFMEFYPDIEIADGEFEDGEFEDGEFEDGDVEESDTED